MTLEITAKEKEVLLEILESVSKETLHAIHHTDTNDFKEMLRQRLEVVDELREKINQQSD